MNFLASTFTGMSETSVTGMSETSVTGVLLIAVALGAVIALVIARVIASRTEASSALAVPVPSPARTFALLTCALGWGLMAAGVAEGFGSTNPDTWHARIPGGASAIIWGIPAAMAVWTLITRRGAWATVALLVIGPLVRTLSYGWAWVIYLTDGAGRGSEGGYYYAGLHLVMVGLVIVTAYLTREDRAVRGEA